MVELISYETRTGAKKCEICGCLYYPKEKGKTKGFEVGIKDYKIGACLECAVKILMLQDYYNTAEGIIKCVEEWKQKGESVWV